MKRRMVQMTKIPPHKGSVILTSPLPMPKPGAVIEMARQAISRLSMLPAATMPDLRRMLSTAMPLSEQDRRRLEALRQRKP